MASTNDADSKRPRQPLRQVDSRAPGWLIADLNPVNRSSRPVKRREWLQSERQEPDHAARIERWRLIVSGHVQGVGYRMACCQKARELELNGWVRNCRDGSVEVQAEGGIHQLTELRLWCERGPQQAEVRSVCHSQLTPIREDWFEIRA